MTDPIREAVTVFDAPWTGDFSKSPHAADSDCPPGPQEVLDPQLEQLRPAFGRLVFPVAKQHPWFFDV